MKRSAAGKGVGLKHANPCLFGLGIWDIGMVSIKMAKDSFMGFAVWWFCLCVFGAFRQGGGWESAPCTNGRGRGRGRGQTLLLLLKLDGLRMSAAFRVWLLLCLDLPERRRELASAAKFL